jgi:phenylacetate-CoA ligase
MKFDFSGCPISDEAFSEGPMTILDATPKAMLAGIVEIALIETGNRKSRERWQKAQLRNLLTHAAQRSQFWRGRMGWRTSDAKLGTLPILTREDVKKQVAAEGPLLSSTEVGGPKPHSTSGSSGVPVQFFVSQVNSDYNQIRSLAQYFIDGKDLSLNRTRVQAAKADTARKLANQSSGFMVQRESGWLGELDRVIKSGKFKYIEYLNPNVRELLKELRKDPVGYLSASPRLIDTIISTEGAKAFRGLEVSTWVSLGEGVDASLARELAQLGIPIRSNYSSEEVGPIAGECETCPGHYHVATSNVIVEVVDISHEVEGRKLGKILVTNLHSYATPFIRYDIGDLGLLGEKCPCGHDGPTVHSLFGRLSAVLKHRDGTLSPFYIRGPDLAALLNFAEFRVRQTDFDTIVVEFGGRDELTADEIATVTEYLKIRAGDEFNIEIIPRPKIDWGDSVKRLAFRSEVH